MNIIRFTSRKQKFLWVREKAKRLCHYPYFLWLHTANPLNDEYGKFDFLLGGATQIKSLEKEDFQNKKWLLGSFSYHWKESIHPKCKNELEAAIPFSDIAFFEPEWVIYSRRNSLEVILEGLPQEIDYQYLKKNTKVQVKPHFTKKEYETRVQSILEHLQRGDIYEVNFAQQFDIEEIELDPITYFEKLIQLSPTPMSALFRWKDKWVFSASQERLLQKYGKKLISQPIKGTIKRHKNPLLDYQKALELFHSQKDRSENVMIVDLVRNDLHRCCKAGSVQVERLFQVQTFHFLHHLVSTISGEAEIDANIEILKCLFPAGSMTGAPKISAMKIIEQQEGIGRGIYSGSIGYFHEGNFDLNVVIRSLVWSEKERIANYHTGGAITLQSSIEGEYLECMLKAHALQKSLNFQ